MLTWIDKGASASFAPTPEFGNDEHGQPSGYKVVGSTWWFHPSFESPKVVGWWDGDLGKAKRAAEADYAQRQSTRIHANAP